MRVPSGKTDVYVYFVAVLGGARVTGLSGFTVYRSRNGAAPVAYTTPTTTELSAANAPGVYGLLIDEDTTIASTSDSEEMALHITKTGMDPVTRTIELYRRAVTTGETIDVASGGVEVGSFQAGAITAAAIATGAIDADAIAADAVTEIQSGLATAAALTVVDDFLDTEVAAIKAKTDTLPAAPAATGDIPTANQNADALLDRTDGVETGLTLRNAMRLNTAVLAGKLSGARSGSEVFRNAVADSKNRLTVASDSTGNRTAITTDLT